MTVYQRKAKLMEVDVADDIVALDPALGQCFGFNNVAAAVWRYLSEPRTVEELTTHLLEQYDVDALQCRVQLEELLEDMVGKQLIEVKATR